MSEPLLQVKNVGKSYGYHEVLKNINFTLERGQILGLVGANGSGKSTLLNIIFGHKVIKTTGGYSGEVVIDGDVLGVGGNNPWITNSIGMVHQEFALFPKLSVSENIKLCNENTIGKLSKHMPNEYSYIDGSKDNCDSERILKNLGVEIETTTLVSGLSTNIKQFVEIARELDRKGLKLLILDEPTAVLNHKDSQLLIDALKNLSKKGVSILFISHRLDEVISLSDQILVLRDGEMIALHDKETTSVEQLAIEMIGEKVTQTQVEKRPIDNDVHLSFKDFYVNYPGEILNKLTMDVYRGEILGITSLSGQGKLAVGKGLIGLYPTDGNVTFNNKDITGLSYKEKINSGLYVLCEDRKNIGLLMNHSIKDNIIFTAQQLYKKYSKKYLKGLITLYDSKKAGDDVDGYIELLDIGCRTHKQLVRELSGGNQQKVCLAKSISLEPEILFVSEPTRGIDIAAKEKVLGTLVKMNKEKGTTIVIASSELEELQRLCNRIVVLSEGKISGILPPDACPKDFGLAFASGGDE